MRDLVKPLAFGGIALRESQPWPVVDVQIASNDGAQCHRLQAVPFWSEGFDRADLSCMRRAVPICKKVRALVGMQDEPMTLRIRRHLQLCNLGRNAFACVCCYPSSFLPRSAVTTGDAHLSFDWNLADRSVQPNLVDEEDVWLVLHKANRRLKLGAVLE